MLQVPPYASAQEGRVEKKPAMLSFTNNSVLYVFNIDFLLIFSGANRSDDQKPTLMKENAVTFDADKLNDPSKAEEELFADTDMDPDAIVGDEDEIGMIVNFNNESLKLENYDGIGRKHRG